MRQSFLLVIYNFLCCISVRVSNNLHKYILGPQVLGNPLLNFLLNYAHQLNLGRRYYAEDSNMSLASPSGPANRTQHRLEPKAFSDLLKTSSSAPACSVRCFSALKVLVASAPFLQ